MPQRKPPPGAQDILLRTGSLSEDPSCNQDITLTAAIFEFLGQLFLLFLRVVWYLVKWALVIAFYAAMFGFFLLLFGTLFYL